MIVKLKQRHSFDQVQKSSVNCFLVDIFLQVVVIVPPRQVVRQGLWIHGVEKHVAFVYGIAVPFIFLEKIVVDWDYRSFSKVIIFVGHCQFFAY